MARVADCYFTSAYAVPLNLYDSTLQSICQASGSLASVGLTETRRMRQSRQSDFAVRPKVVRDRRRLTSGPLCITLGLTGE